MPNILKSREMNKLLIIIDYRDHFYSSIRNKYSSMDHKLIKINFNNNGFEVLIKEFSEINLRSKNYSGWFVLYQSSEDENLLYKSYIDDIIYGLKFQGAILIPEYKYFKAHHNKVFMELLRDLSKHEGIKNIKSNHFGTKEEYEALLPTLDFPVIVKAAEGAGSRGVALISTNKECRKFIKKISASLSLIYAVKNKIKSFINKNYRPYSNHRKKFVIQNYIRGLSNDYKILIYSNKLYILKRNNRKNDFRASGSGLFEFVDDLPVGIFEYAYDIYLSFNVPYISLDIAFDGTEFVLIEFQFISFGTYTLEKSSFYFELIDGIWKKIESASILENVFVDSVVNYISCNYKNE